jgi:ribonuclease HI
MESSEKLPFHSDFANIMTVPTPHFLLIAGRGRRDQPEDWRFTIQSDDGQPCFEVADCEPEVQGERLELLAVIRGLESFDQPSRVTLFTDSAYVSRGLNYGLHEWRDNNWQWECHGSMVPVKNSDLWKRLDRTLQIHQVECRLRRLEPEEGGNRRLPRSIGDHQRQEVAA